MVVPRSVVGFVSSTLTSENDCRCLPHTCPTTVTYQFTVDFILMGAVLIEVNALKFCTHFFFWICWTFWVAAGSDLKHMDCLTKERNMVVFSNGNISFHLSSLLQVSSDTDFQSYNITKTTYLTVFSFFAVSVQNPSKLSLRNSYKAIEPWISEMFLSARWSVMYPYPYWLNMQHQYYLCRSKFPFFSLPQWTSIANRQ